MDVESVVPEAGNLEGFIEQFEVFAGAPGGVSILRELILKLAVRGLLIPSKMQTINSKPLNEDFNIFKLPEGWETQIIENVVNKDKWSIKRGPFGSAIKKSFFVASGYKVYEQQHAIYNDFSRGDYYITEEKFDELKAFQVKPSDLIISCSGTVGKVAEAPRNMEIGIINQALLKISLNQEILLNDYFKVLFQAYFMNTPELSNLKGTAQKNMVSVKTLKSLPFPYPPLEEQKRIVAKVDELMALCDTLEAQQQQQANNVLRANTAAINALLNPDPQGSEKSAETAGTFSASDPKASFEKNWQRIAQHFNTLYGCTLPMPKGEGRKKKHLVGLENVKALRQVILQLAVAGKLTKQLPESASALILLEEVKGIKQKLIQDGILKKKKALPEILDEDQLFELPINWVFCRLNDAIDVRDGTHDSPKAIEGVDSYPLITSKDFKNGGIDFENAKRISEEDHFNIAKRSLVEVDDILFSMIGGNIGNQVMVSDSRPFSIKNVALFKYYDKNITTPLYVKIFTDFLADRLQQQAIGGAQPFISLGALRKLVFPLPPLEEQKRIVKKVDQLMTLCDQLEQQLTQSYSDAEKLMQATVKALVA